MNIGSLISTVQHNCHISDARYAGNYTMCIFLLKMREFYRWENDIALTAPMPRAEIGDWLVERENTWTQIEETDYQPLELRGESVDPFEASRINEALVPQGFVYSSGYGLHQKPHFFLGQLESVEKRGDLTIYISSCEYARDLVAPPAMMRDNTVFIRQESLRRYLWERIEGWQFNKSNRQTPMGLALELYGYSQDQVVTVLDRMTRDETEAVILHETGEAEAGKALGNEWEEMLATFPSSKVEFMARASRDLLADCLSTLPELIRTGNEASLHFHFANMTGLRKHLYPELYNAYETWTKDHDIQQLHHAVERGQDYWTDKCRSVLDLYRQQDSRADDAIVELLEPATN
ncbi:MAG: hypothetical protein R3188_06395 [Acidiferrobacterales bacterium]|nr:hypothetical protein [Acidiferrobacterales bacterium]